MEKIKEYIGPRHLEENPDSEKYLGDGPIDAKREQINISQIASEAVSKIAYSLPRGFDGELELGHAHDLLMQELYKMRGES